MGTLRPPVEHSPPPPPPTANLSDYHDLTEIEAAVRLQVSSCIQQSSSRRQFWFTNLHRGDYSVGVHYAASQTSPFKPYRSLRKAPQSELIDQSVGAGAINRD